MIQDRKKKQKKNKKEKKEHAMIFVKSVFARNWGRYSEVQV